MPRNGPMALFKPGPAERMLNSNKRDDLEEYHRLVTPKKKIQQATVCWIFLSMLPLNK